MATGDDNQERLTDPGELAEDRQLCLRLRPERLAEFIGQEELKANLGIALEAARGRGEALDHALFYGPPGLGKTTLAHIIAAEMGTTVITAAGPALERPGDLVGILTNLEEGQVFFIDEIHRLPRVVEEYLYGAMEDFQVDFMVDRGPYARSLRLTLKPFTLVGATTRSGLLTAPLRERFGIVHHLDFYEPEQLARIVLRSAGLLGVEVSEEGAREIARRSRGTPRIANRLLRRVRDFAQVRSKPTVEPAVADEALRMLGVDEAGLDHLDRKVLVTIIEHYAGGPVGLEAIAATLSEQADTLEETVEPFLLKIGFLNRTPRGRKASVLAYKHLGYPQPREQGEKRQGTLF